MRRINAALEELVGKIINEDGTWQYDDTNYLTHPRGTGTLVEGQEDYTFTSEYLQIEAIEIKNANGNWYLLKPLDHSELDGQSPAEYFGVDSSGNPVKNMPECFDQNGDTIRLYPAPAAANVTLSGGIRVWFKRTADIFTSAQVTTGTKEPGLPSPYHVLLAYMAAIPYNEIYHPERVPRQQLKIDRMTKELLEHYAHREKSRIKRITAKLKSFR